MSTLPSVSRQISSAVVVAVDRRVGRVLELLGHEIPLVGLGQLLGLGDRARHAFGARRQDEFGAVGEQQLPALDAHRLGHRQHDLVAARRGHHRQRDTGVPARRLEDDGVRLEQTRLFGGVDHGDPDAVFHAVRRVEEFQLRHDVGAGAIGYPTQPDQWGVSDQLCDVLGNAHLSSSNLYLLVRRYRYKTAR